MQKLHFLSILFLITAYVHALRAGDKGQAVQVTETKFAMSIVHSVNSQVATFAVVTLLDNKVIKSNYLTIDQFIMQASGLMASPANPDKKNLFSEYKIDHCYSDFEDFSNKYIGYYCPVLTSIWKVRYKRDPKSADSRKNNGWARNYYGPSENQLKFLTDQYGIRTMSDYFIGEKMFQLLFDTQDTAWQRRYKELM